MAGEASANRARAEKVKAEEKPGDDMMLWDHRSRSSGAFALLLLLSSVVWQPAHAIEPTIQQLKDRFKDATIGERPKLGVQIAQRQMAEADKLYAANDFDKGKATLTDVVAYTELTRDYAIQSHKYQKQSEIAVRGIIRRLHDLLHSLPRADQPPVQDAISRLQRIRDDLLAAMFPKGAK